MGGFRSLCDKNEVNVFFWKCSFIEAFVWLCRKHPFFLPTFSGVFAVPAGKGKLKVISVWTSSRYDRGT